MLPALWVAKTGLSAQDTNLTTISNNLANVSTTGFKRDRAEFQDLLYQIKKQPGAQSTQDSELPSGLQLGTGVAIVGTQKNFSAGNLQQTGQPLDMARLLEMVVRLVSWADKPVLATHRAGSILFSSVRLFVGAASQIS